MEVEKVLEIKRVFEQGDISSAQLARNYGIGEETVRRILNGSNYGGIGYSDKYMSGAYLKKEVVKKIIADYEGGIPIPDILTNYSIDREKLGYIRVRHNIPDRNTNRATTLKSITLEINGEIKTYPSVEAASKQTGIANDFLHKLKRAETFCEGKFSKKDVILVHDLNRLQYLESSCELMSKILTEGTASDKFKWGQDLKSLLYKLGYAKEDEVETINN